jgi:hypothetical protein
MTSDLNKNLSNARALSSCRRIGFMVKIVGIAGRQVKTNSNY